MTVKLIAHVYEEDGKWIEHSLSRHLKKVAALAQRFADKRGGQYVKAAGILHDLGKAQEAWQAYLKNAVGYHKENAHVEEANAKRGDVKHAMAGAKYAVETLRTEPLLGYILAYLIAGHHAGLADWMDKGSLKERLHKADQGLADALQGWQANGLAENFFELSAEALIRDFPVFLQQDFPKEVHIWLRFLFSCLVDADFLDTEAFMKGCIDADDAKQQGVRPSFPDLDVLHERYEQFMQQLADKADKKSTINLMRQDILKQCFKASTVNKSLFSLTVPTGGGKTLASLGFALKHALHFNKKRIIYAIPFTSIIEQNAQVFKKALGEDVVLEHHSNLDIQEDKQTAKTRVVAENWDAPLIVTTNVQFFESLFASKTSRCRKIHNIADSVVILDEAQQIPREFQKPITDMMRVLARDYGVSFVLCTATQPELGKDTNNFGKVLMEGLSDVYEIIDDKTALAHQLRRVQVHFPDKDAPRQSWQQVADEIAGHDCVMAVVNTRKHAQKLFSELPSDGIKLHLSANMCAMHRAEVIALIREYLRLYHEGKLTVPLWVVSTQLIEAGVDLDFPVVYRAMAGLDSIAQAAGRCNREGKLPDLGKVVVFRAEEGAPNGSLKQGQDITEEMLHADLLADPFSPEAFRQYFLRFNRKDDRDKYQINDCLTASMKANAPLGIAFRTAAERFHLIDNQGVTLVVPFLPLVWHSDGQLPQIVNSSELSEFFKTHLSNKPSEIWQEELKQYRYPNQLDADFGTTDKPSLPEPFETWFCLLENDPLKHKWVYRKLQRYTITVYEHQLKKLPAGVVYERAGLLMLSEGYYQDVLGADFDDEGKLFDGVVI